jgi:hypothetical protein
MQLFDHLVGDGKERGRHGQTESLGGRADGNKESARVAMIAIKRI